MNGGLGYMKDGSPPWGGLGGYPFTPWRTCPRYEGKEPPSCMHYIIDHPGGYLNHSVVKFLTRSGCHLCDESRPRRSPGRGVGRGYRSKRSTSTRTTLWFGTVTGFRVPVVPRAGRAACIARGQDRCSGLATGACANSDVENYLYRGVTIRAARLRAAHRDRGLTLRRQRVPTGSRSRQEHPGPPSPSAGDQATVREEPPQ